MEKIDVVIPLKDISKNNNFELRYALRGIEKHLKNFKDIYIVGQRVPWLTNVKYINVKDGKSSKFKEANIFNKISACIKSEVSENFLFMNDDHFLIRDMDAITVPFYYKGEIVDTMSRNTGNYRKTMNHSRKYLQKKGKPTLDFDTHVPIIYNKEKIMCTFGDIDWSIPYGYGIKSLYCNMNDVEPIHEPDCKINNKCYETCKEKTKDRFCFSTGSLNPDMIRFIEESYPNASIYEK